MKRPLAVSVVAVLVAISGFASLVGASGALRAERFLVVDFAKLGSGPVLLFLAWGLWRQKRWIWFWALLVVGLDMLLSMYALFSIPREIGPLITLIAWIDFSLALIVVYLLSRPDVQAAFGHRVR